MPSKAVEVKPSKATEDKPSKAAEDKPSKATEVKPIKARQEEPQSEDKPIGEKPKQAQARPGCRGGSPGEENKALG